MYKKILILAFVTKIFAATSIQYGLPSATLINQIDINYANKKAMYREIFTNGLEKIVANVAEQKLTKNSWGVVFSLDGTLLDDSNIAAPGAPQITCKITKLGGVVSIVTDRSGVVANNNDFINQTTKELDKQGICYSNIVFAQNNNDTNKNPRFNAVISGDYENIITTKRLPPIQIIAYFGNKIEDFPNLKQNLANTAPVSDNMFSQFGQQYFMLPR
jgi:hypothetical protein